MWWEEKKKTITFQHHGEWQAPPVTHKSKSIFNLLFYMLSFLEIPECGFYDMKSEYISCHCFYLYSAHMKTLMCSFTLFFLVWKINLDQIANTCLKNKMYLSVDICINGTISLHNNKLLSVLSQIKIKRHFFSLASEFLQRLRRGVEGPKAEEKSRLLRRGFEAAAQASGAETQESFWRGQLGRWLGRIFWGGPSHP